MKMSDLLKMNVTANDLIRTMDWSHTPRTIRKARRGQVTARQRVGWDDDIIVLPKQRAQLEKLEGQNETEGAKREASQDYYDALAVWRTACAVESLDCTNETVKATKAAKVATMRARTAAGDPAIPKALEQLNQKLIKIRKERKDVLHS